jgi:protein phosphatase-4 regulatory subunit 3
VSAWLQVYVFNSARAGGQSRQKFLYLTSLTPCLGGWHSFAQELCSIAKYLQPVHRAQLFNTLICNGLFNVMTLAVGAPVPKTRLFALDILLSSLHQDPSTLRNFLNHQPKHELFGLLISGLVTSDQDGVQEQTLEILRLLLDPESVESSVNLFLETFYDKYVDQLVGALAYCLTSKPPGE